MVLSEKRLKKLTWILAAVFIGVMSFFVCAGLVPETSIVERSVESLDDSKDMVVKFSAATLALSVAITLLPDDWATPIADTLADMSTYFVLILGIIYLEKLLVLWGMPLAFKLLIPAACILYILFIVSSRKIFSSIAKKIAIIAMAVVLAVPCSTFISEIVCSEGLAYVEDTISLAESESDSFEELSNSPEKDASFYEKVSALFQTAISGVKDLFEHFKSVTEKCINSIAILLIAYCVIPALTFLLIIWLVKQLFQVQGIQMLLDKLDPRQIRLFIREDENNGNIDMNEEVEKKE